jgi:DNA polymerase
MTGFFSNKQVESITRPNGKVYSCSSCGLHLHVNTPRMKPYGNFSKGIIIVGEAPGEIEDSKGKPWQGKTGRLLQHTLRDFGIDLFEDCLSIHACHCKPMDEKGNNRNPSNFEIESCRKTTLSYIKQYKPKIVILLGNAAIYSIIGHRWKKDLGNISKWRGWTIPDRDFNCWVCPTFHPSYIERSEDDVAKIVWKKDLELILSLLNKPFPEYKEPIIDIITDLSVLYDKKMGTNKIFAAPHIAIDYETTGIKPHSIGHRIVCVSIADNEDHAYVFMLPTTRMERKPFVDLLANKDIFKMAHNMKFEETWSVVRLQQSVISWAWDSMQAAHILDNRRYITGLKFQVYVNFGIVDYDSDISPYLKSKDEEANSLNRIHELINIPGGKEKLMHYCGLDSVFTYRLAMIQKPLIINNYERN